MDLFRMLGVEAKGGARSQAVAEAPSQEVVEAPSQDVVEVSVPPETSRTSAALHEPEPEEPRYPNRKDALAQGAEDDSDTCADTCAARRVRPAGANGRRRTRLPASGNSDKKRNYQNRVVLEWKPEIPDFNFSVRAVFIQDHNPLLQVQRKAGTDAKNVPVCIPLWPTYSLSVKGTGVAKSCRWLHFNKLEQWCRAIQKIHQLDRSIDVLKETRQHIRDAIITSRKTGGMLEDPEQSDEESNDEEKGWRSGRFKKMPVLRIKVLDHVLTVVNNLRPLAIEASDASSTFIRDVVVPSIRKARSQTATVPENEEPAPFNFSGQDPLHLPTQVLWKPSTFSYELVLKGKGAKAMDTTTDLEGHLLRVPPHRTGETFQAARKRIFQLACQAWDQRDTSKRPRILPESTAA